MRRSTLIPLTLAALVPLQVFAAFASPSALFWALHADASPRQFTMEAHVQLPEEQVFISIWAKGSHTGGRTNADGQADITFDVVSPKDGVKARAKMGLIVIDNREVYLKVHSVTGSLDDMGADLSAELTGKQWMRLAMPDETPETGDPAELISQLLATQGMDATKEEVESLLKQVVDAVLSMQSKQTAAGTVYTFSPKRHFAQEAATIVHAFLAKATGEAMTMTPDNMKDLQKLERELLRHMKLNLTVTAGANDAFKGTSADLSVRSLSPAFSLTLKGRTTMVATLPGITAPAGAVDIETVLPTLNSNLLPSGFMPSMSSMPTTPVPMMTLPSKTDAADPCAIHTANGLNAVRKGNCGTSARTSRRLLHP